MSGAFASLSVVSAPFTTSSGPCGARPEHSRAWWCWRHHGYGGAGHRGAPTCADSFRGMNTDTYRPARKGTGVAAIVLWLALAIAATVNVLSSFAGLSVIVQVAAGAVVLVCVLLLTERYRRRREAAKR
ncbi:hypothetical protein SAMN05421504_1011215 [Amycolatopsis xylanica]|uniref:Uncharacterized protein n=2 Tax=Amycolatopsis xylanica TaxID=589385 RepID=A0A1H2VG67_9PSEU|nr:hypothetical protein SAMN05421504_1011215 [Amycolatopsis xylanica]